MAHFFIKQNGISLIETLIALGLTLLIMAFAWDFSSFCYKQFSQVEHQVEIQQQARIGLDMLISEIKKAGYGLTPAWPAFTALGPTSITFLSNLKEIQTRLTTDAFSGSNTLSVKFGNDFPTGKSILICTENVCEEETLNSHGSASTLTLKNPLNHSFPSGSSVNILNRVTYYLNQKNQLLRKVDQGGANEVANQVQTLKFVYLDEKRNSTWNPKDVRLVKINLETQSKKGGQRTYSSSIGIRNR